MTKTTLVALASFALAIAGCGGRVANEPLEPLDPPAQTAQIAPPAPTARNVRELPPPPAPLPQIAPPRSDVGQPGPTPVAGGPGADVDGGSPEACDLLTFHVDADGDGFGSATQVVLACAPAAGLVTNGNDCYDGNAQAHPGQTAFFAVDRGDGSFDYDCDGAATLADPDPEGPYCICSNNAYASGCSGTNGWIDPVPACGQSASFAEFVAGGQTCSPPGVARVQSCN